MSWHPRIMQIAGASSCSGMAMVWGRRKVRHFVPLTHKACSMTGHTIPCNGLLEHQECTYGMHMTMAQMRKHAAGCSRRDQPREPMISDNLSRNAKPSALATKSSRKVNVIKPL